MTRTKNKETLVNFLNSILNITNLSENPSPHNYVIYDKVYMNNITTTQARDWAPKSTGHGNCVSTLGIRQNKLRDFNLRGSLSEGNAN